MMNFFMSVAIMLHLLAALVWVGGMFFSYWILRPVFASQMIPPNELPPLWRQIYKRFFTYVWISIIVLFITGFWMMLYGLGGFGAVPISIHLMMTLAIIMVGIFVYIQFGPFQKMCQSIDTGDKQAAAAQMVKLRTVISINMYLGIFVVLMAAGSRYLGI